MLIPKKCEDCDYTQVKFKEKSTSLVCGFTERPVSYYYGKHRSECPMPEFIIRTTFYDLLRDIDTYIEESDSIEDDFDSGYIAGLALAKNRIKNKFLSVCNIKR